LLLLQTLGTWSKTARHSTQRRIILHPKQTTTNPTLPNPNPQTQPNSGGLIFWADLVGADKIVAKLDALSAKFAPVGAGGFFEPCAYLRVAAESGRKLSAGVVQSRM
jgi:hypothetical protein